ncbi:MAG: YbhB/YbcL family Raf kinase inhibitor-like protein [Candidatus Omnitrophota bacterium]
MTKAPFIRQTGLPFLIALMFALTSTYAYALELKSPKFNDGDRIPVQYSGKGENISPPLFWNDVPDGTESLALIMDDPRAPTGTWVHWVIYDIPATARSLAENIPRESRLEDGTLQGINSFRWIGYSGPFPPAGPAHRYIFRLYALDTTLNLPADANKGQVINAMQGHVLAEANLAGIFSTGEDR